MPGYHVGFWSEKARGMLARDIVARDCTELLDRLSGAGREALALRRSALFIPDRLPQRPSALELGWLAITCGPLWLFVVGSYYLS